MTALCEMAVVEQVRIQIKAAETISLNLTADLMETQIFTRSGGLLGKIRDLVFAKWNEGELPTAPGLHENQVFVPNPVKIWHSGRMVDADVLANLTVAILRYVGEVESPNVDPPDFASGWRMLAPDEPFDAEVTFEGVQSY